MICALTANISGMPSTGLKQHWWILCAVPCKAHHHPLKQVLERPGTLYDHPHHCLRGCLFASPPPVLCAGWSLM